MVTRQQLVTDFYGKIFVLGKLRVIQLYFLRLIGYIAQPNRLSMPYF